jgi:hypothetical protein
VENELNRGMRGDQPSRDEIIGWLLDGDPSIRWQALRDLEGVPEPVWKLEQMRVSTEGWGARLLSHQDSVGRWTPRLYGKKWLSTTYSLVLLRRLGLPAGDPRALRSCSLFLDEGLADDGGMDLSAGRSASETCITAMVLACFAWFGFDDPRREQLLDFLLAEQLADGGWNCRSNRVHGSFHTTISVLEALHEYAQTSSYSSDQVTTAAARGREFLLMHRLFRSHHTGEVASPALLKLSFPPRWHFDVLRGLDHFYAARKLEDDRLQDAIDVVEEKRRADGTWPLQQRWPGETWFEMEKVGGPSRWNTLRAMRALEAWRDARADQP